MAIFTTVVSSIIFRSATTTARFFSKLPVSNIFFRILLLFLNAWQCDRLGVGLLLIFLTLIYVCVVPPNTAV